jgi:hypothetical protein
MSKATESNTTSPSRFHNLTDGALADQIGKIDAIVKAAEAELKALKEELKVRGLEEAHGDEFTVTVTEQIAGRMDTKAVKEFLGASYSKFEVAIVSSVVRVKAVRRLSLAIALAA